MRRQSFREKAGAAERVDEESVVAGKGCRDEISQRVGDRVVGLREDARAGVGAQRVMAVARPGRAQLRERVVHFRHRDRALRDIHQLVNIAPVKTDDVILRMDGDPVPIAVGQRRRNDGAHRRIAETSDAAHRLFDLAGLEFELVVVADVLIAAAAAASEVRAGRGDAFGRWLQDLDQFRFGELLFLPDDFRRDALAIDRKGNEDGFAGIARHAFAAESDVFDLQFGGAHRAL